MKMRGDENTESKGEQVKIPPFAEQSKEKEQDNGHVNCRQLSNSCRKVKS